MYRNILVPVVFDHTPSENDALAVALDLINAGGKVTLLHVVEEIPVYVAAQLPDDIFDGARSEAEEKLKAIAQQAPHPVNTRVVQGHSSRTILSYAEDTKADCIVISSHKPGVGDYFLGSTAARVVRHAKCSVHVLR